MTRQQLHDAITYDYDGHRGRSEYLANCWIERACLSGGLQNIGWRSYRSASSHKRAIAYLAPLSGTRQPLSEPLLPISKAFPKRDVTS